MHQERLSGERVDEAGLPIDSKAFRNIFWPGYLKFMSGRFSEQQQRYKTLAESGQKPKTMVSACCDSRAAPETIFDAGPGELFVVRNVANIMPPYEPMGIITLRRPLSNSRFS